MHLLLAASPTSLHALLAAAVAMLLVVAPARARASTMPTRVDEIVVVGSKSERPLSSVAAQVTTIDRVRLDREQVQNIADIARYEPAISADLQTPRFGATGLSIRGIGGNRVAIEVDGVPLPARFSVGNFADSGRLVLDPAIVSRIEILRGPASVLYGSDAIGGVVVVSTVEPHELVEPGRRVHAGVGTGYFGSVDGVLARATGAWANPSEGVLLSVVQRRGNQPANRARQVPSDLLDFAQWQVFAKWTRETAAGGGMTITLDAHVREVDTHVRSILGFERFATTERLLGDDEQRTGRALLEYRLPRLDWLDEASFRLYVQDTRTEQRTDERRTTQGTPLRIERDFLLRERGTGSEIRLRRDFSTAFVDHVAVAGVEWDRQRLVQQRDGLQTNLATQAATKTLLGEVFPLRDVPQTTSDKVGVFAQNEMSVGRFALIPGLRWDYYRLDAETDALVSDPSRLTDLSDDDVTFRLGSTFRAAEPLTVFLSYAEGFRSPPAEDVNLLLDLPLVGARALPNPDLRSERSRNVEAGLRWREDGLSGSVGFYYAIYDDFIESRARIGTDPESGLLLFQSRNVENATIFGAEADANLALRRVYPGLDSWFVDAGVHWARGENDDTNEPLNTVAPLKAVAGLRKQFVEIGVDAELRLTYLARQTRVDTTAGEVFVPPSATVLDLLVAWAPVEWLDLQLNVHNLTNERYWNFGDVRRYVPGDPRAEIASQPGVHANVSVNVRY